eukprot:TRINITY_DN6054_c0_g1_i2.p1 TRINITY_DN6054_c0_g1~~TRINITY_DN6054_c0_g1_i2.p1  ORF type:complete len:770 (-),score=168.60 TRINITY_DN6054_c0_g1_i2:12-2321(-)
MRRNKYGDSFAKKEDAPRPIRGAKKEEKVNPVIKNLLKEKEEGVTVSRVEEQEEVLVNSYERQLHEWVKKGLTVQAGLFFKQLTQPGLSVATVTMFNTMLKLYQDQRDSVKFKNVLDQLLAHETLKPNLRSYEIILEHVRDTSVRLKDSKDVFEQLQNSGFPPSLRAYNTLLEVYASFNKLAEVEELFKTIKTKGLTPDTTTYRILIQFFLKANRPDKASQITQEMKSVLDIPDTPKKAPVLQKNKITNVARETRETKETGVREESEDILGRVPRTQAQQSRDRQAQITGRTQEWDVPFEGLEDPLPVASLSVEEEELAKIQIFQAETAFQTRKASQEKMDTNVYNDLLYVYCKNFKANEARNLVAEMIKNNVPRDLMTYNTLLDLYTKMKDYTQAEILGTQMRKEGIVANEVTYNMLIDMSGKKQNPDKEACEAYYLHMKEKGLTPTCVTFTTMISLYSSLNDTEAAERILQEMQDAGVEPDEMTFTTLIHMYRNTRNFMKVVKFCKMMKEKFEDAFSAFFFRTLMMAYHELNQGFRAERVIDEVLEKVKEGKLVLNQSLCNAMLVVYKDLKSKDKLTKAEILWNKMLMEKIDDKEKGTKKKESIQPDLTSFNIMLEMYVEAGRTRDAVRTFREMEGRNISPDLRTYHRLIELAVKRKEVEGAENTFLVMKKKGIQPTPAIYAEMISLYVKKNTPEKALVLAMESRSTGARLNLVTYNRLMASCSKLRPNDVPKLIKMMKEDNVQPNDKTREYAKAAWEKVNRREVVA